MNNKFIFLNLTVANFKNVNLIFAILIIVNLIVINLIIY